MRNLRLLFLALAVLSALLALAGCSGGGAAGSDENGRLTVSVTDAPGDFSAYDVRIVDVKLARPNGAVVWTLPVNARVDFNSLTQTSEIIAVGAVPQGEYTGVSLRLDYSDAEVWVEKDGVPVKALTVDAQGNPLGVVEMPVTFDGNGRMQITRGHMKDMTLDFNLAATNSVDISQQVPVVTVNPFLVAEVEPNGPKGAMARGPLLSADQGGAFFTIGIRPRGANSNLGEMEIQVDADTLYEVDGVQATGAEGFALLAAKGVGTAVVAEGRMGMRGAQQRGGNMGGGDMGGGDMGNGDMGGGNMGNGNMGNGNMGGDARGFLAARVRAGSSVMGGDLDALHGTVIARTGDVLTVAGGVADRADGMIYGATVSVLMGDSTVVVREGSILPASIADVSVGQKVTAFGAYDGAASVLNAENGRVRMEYTRVAGSAKEVTGPQGDAGGLLVLDANRLGGLPVGEFDFSGTGADAASDADPSEYAVATGPFDLSGLLPGDPVIAIGFPSPFGMAPPDFYAVSLVEMREAAAELSLAWDSPSAAALSEVAVTGFTAHADGAAVCTLRFGDAAVPLPEDAAIAMAPASGSPLSFAISEGGGAPEVYPDFAGFAADLAARLEGGKMVAALFARGYFDPVGMTFTANRIAVRLQ